MSSSTTFLESQPTVIHHDANTTGRDFIVGDLHGCTNMLMALLDHVHFDPSADRVFSVGDLVDRGSDSEGCLALLESHWFHAVLGDHDAMLMAWILGKTRDLRQQMYEYAFTHNKGWQWAKEFTRGAEFLPLLESLPLVRVIAKNAGDQRFHVAHAELRMPYAPPMLGGNPRGFNDLDIDEISSPLWDMEHYITGFGDVGTWHDHVLWGRSLIGEVKRCARENEPLPQETYPYLSTTYVGHTIIPPVFGQTQNAPLRTQSHVFLDSGAFKAGPAGGNGPAGGKTKDGKDGDPRFGLTLWCHQENRGWMMGGDGAVRDLQEECS